MVEHDRYITNMRLTIIKDTITEILEYEYRTKEQEANTKVCRRESSVLSEKSADTSEVYYDARESVNDDLSASFKRDTRLNSTDTVVQAGKYQLPEDPEGEDDDDFGLGIKMDKILKEELAEEGEGEGVTEGGEGDAETNGDAAEDDEDEEDDDEADEQDIRYSLDIYNRERAQMMNAALEQVRKLLGKLDVSEQYYASSKMFRGDHPAVGRLEFQSRVKCLCMWYNLTMQLRSKIDVLGNLLLGMGIARKKVPWPTWFFEPNGYYGMNSSGHFSDESGITSPLSSSQNLPAGSNSCLSRDTSVQDIEQAVRMSFKETFSLPS